MSKYTHDIVATVGEFTNRSGETKKKYQKCGAAFTGDDGRVSLKLDAVPCSPDWSGWLSLYPKKEYDAPQAQQRPAQEPVRQQAAPTSAEGQDDIPF